MTGRLPARSRALVVAFGAALWALVMRGLGSPALLWQLGLLASVVSATLLLTDGAALRAALAPTRRSLLGGVAATSVMLAATYGGYPLAVRLWPDLAGEVDALYRLLAVGGAGGVAVVWLLPIIVAEELLFRGTAWQVGEGRSPWAVALGSTLVYGAAQFGAGSVALLALSLVCGAYWAGWRAWSGSLWPGLLSHVAWNAAVLLLWPLGG